MSDHEENISEVGFRTPVPELDDHRHPPAGHSQAIPPVAQQFSPQSPVRTERARRGTFDTLYGAQLLGSDEDDSVRGHRDTDEAIMDDEPELVTVTATPRRPRRSTIETIGDQRSESPPNSVKAFAEARRREREMSFSEARPNRKLLEPGLYRTASNISRSTYRSRSQTVEDDVASISSKKTAEDDVCFPVQEAYKKDHLYIDFDYLENFIQSDRAARELREQEAKEKTFGDLRKQHTNTQQNGLQLTTLDGDILTMPSDTSTTQGHDEKTDLPEPKLPQQQQHIDKNRFSFFSSAWESTIHAPDFDDLILPGEDIRGLFTLPPDEADGVWWLNVNEPTKEEVAAICKAFGVHPLTIEDITTQEAREKIELFPSYYFASFRSFYIAEEEDGGIEYEPFNIYVVVFREGTLSFSFHPSSHASHVRKRIALLKDYVALSSDWICYALIDDIVDCFAPTIRKVEVEADQIEDEVFIAREMDSNEFLRSIGRTRKNCMALMRLLGGKADVLRGFTKRCNENFKVTPRMDIGMYLGDIQDHVVTMVTNLGHFEKILARSHSNYLAQISVHSIEQGTEMNRVLSKMTFLASILVPMNIVTGLFGMNVLVPFADGQNLIPFFTIVGFLVVFVICVIFWARKARFI